MQPWIPDHKRKKLFAVARPGGRGIAQTGSGGDLKGVETLNPAVALESLVTDLLALVASLPLVVVGMRSRPSLLRLRLLGLSMFVLLATNLASNVNAIFGIAPSGLRWNWVGKLACMLTLALLIPMLPGGTLKRSCMFRLPAKGSALPVFIALAFCGLLGWAASGASGMPSESETLAFQMLMPSLAEEPVHRAILPALLALAFGSPWKLGQARVGWWWLIISLWFAAGHGLFWSESQGVQFDAVGLIGSGMVALLFGWLAVRSRSVLPCLIGHSLINSTGLVIAMLST